MHDHSAGGRTGRLDCYAHCDGVHEAVAARVQQHLDETDAGIGGRRQSDADRRVQLFERNDGRTGSHVPLRHFRRICAADSDSVRTV